MRRSAWRAWAGVACGLIAVRCLAALPQAWSPADLKELDGQGWGPVAKDGERSYRAALKDKAAVVRVPAWWGDGVRPAKGTVYVLEIAYKDVAAAPVMVEAFGALGSYYGRTELHRFGGENDGAWKVAQVPVSWDLILKPKGTASAEFALRAPADLPVASLRVREAAPGDQARYEAESRAWVAKVQAAKAVGAKYWSSNEVAVIPEASQGKALVPYVRNYYDRIHPNSAPQRGEVGATLHVRMARNEFEPATFAVYAQEDLAGVEFTVSDLTGPAGKLACEVRRHTAEYALEPSGKGGYAWDPERLWPAFGATIRKGESGWFWITVHTLGEASQPGSYRGTVAIKAGAHAAELPLQVDVLPITLLTMDEAGLRMGGCVAGFATEQELATMREHNHNMVNLWFAGAQPDMRLENGAIALDFTYLDEWMRQAKANGVNTIVWFLGGNPNGYPETLSIERELYAEHGGKKDDFFKHMGTPEGRGKVMAEVRPLYKKWLQDVVAHGKAAAWPELIFTPFDEPAKWAYPTPKPEKRKYAIGCGPWIRDHFKDACALIHEAVPGTKVYISMHRNFYREVHGTKGRVGEIFIPDCDVICSNAIEEDHELGDKVRRAGKEFWQYSGNRSRRWGFGFYFGSWDSRGSLCWAYNWGKRFDVTEGSNWEYAWYSPFGTILTPDYEEMREAWDDRRYLETVKSAAKKAGQSADDLLKQIRTEVQSERGAGGRDLVNDFWEEGRNANRMDYWRKLLADKIVELGKK